MSRFLTLDWYYPEAFAAAAKHPGGIFDFSHGTSDYLDIALRAAGHEAETIVVNADPHWQVKLTEFKPTHVISQNVGMWGAYAGSPLDEFRRFMGCKLIGFCSYRAVDQTLTGWDALFSSFKWMPEHCATLGQKCHYLPLAFGKPVLERIGELPKERDIPVAFIGGLGSRIWDQGTKTMAAIAEAVPEFRWWGYKVDALPPSLERTHQGQAWGLDMYRILARTKICMNRHGEISRGSGNNMRQWESHGLKCCLLTDQIGELRNCPGTFAYGSADEAIDKIRIIQDISDGIAFDLGCKLGQDCILENHTYDSRVHRFLEVIESLA